MGGFGGGSAGKLELPKQLSDTVENWFSGDTLNSIDDELNTLFSQGVVTPRTLISPTVDLLGGVNWKIEPFLGMGEIGVIKAKDTFDPSGSTKFKFPISDTSKINVGQKLSFKVQYYGKADEDEEDNGFYIYLENNEAWKVFVPTPKSTDLFLEKTSIITIEVHNMGTAVYFERKESLATTAPGGPPTSDPDTHDLAIAYISIVNPSLSNNPYTINSAYSSAAVLPFIKSVATDVKDVSDEIDLTNEQLVYSLSESRNSLQGLITEGENEVSSLIDETITHINDKLSDILDEVIPDDTVQADTESLMDSFISKAKTTAGELSTSSTTKVINAINSFIDNQPKSSEKAVAAVATGLTKAITYYTDTELDIDDIVEDFEEVEREKISQQISQFNGRMAALDAVNSSAFIIGNSMLEREFSRSVSGMKNQLLLKKYELDVMQNIEKVKMFMSTYSQNLNQSLSNYYNVIIGLVDSYLRSYGYEIQNSSNMYQQLRQKFSQILQTQKEIYLGFSQAEMSSKEGRVLDLRDKTSRLIGLAANDLFNNIKRKDDYKNLYTEYLREYYKIQLATEKEETDRNLEIDVKDKLWNLQAYQMAGNVVAQASGGAGYIPNNPSQQENAVGAALSAGAAGFKFSGGNPIAGVGAALAGYLIAGGNF